MKTKTFIIVFFLFTSILTYSQTFHSDIQIDAEKSWTYSHGINRESVTLIIDLIKSKFSITSSFLTAQNLDLILLDARVENDENGQFKKSKYEIQNKGNSFGMYLYIEDNKNVKSELIVGKYNKGFALQLIKDGKQTSFLACYIKELDLLIKYDPKTFWCHYNKSYTSNYRVEGVETGEIKRTKVLIEIDTVNNYFSLNNQMGHKFTFVSKGESKFLERIWKFNKYQIEGSEGEFLFIFETDPPLTVENSLYYKIYSIKTIDPSTNKITSNIDLFVSNSPETDEGQPYITPEEAPN
jgi:hypothetical protein